MTDDLRTPKNEHTGTKFTPHPEGPTAGICVDIIPLGEQVHTYQGITKIRRRVAVVFQTAEVDEEGKNRLLSQEFTHSLHENSKLRPFLGSWRGKGLTDVEAEDDGPKVILETFLKKPAMLNVAHEEKGDKTFVNISSVMPLPKGMTAPSGEGYQRPEFWGKKRERYASEVKAYKASVNAQHMANDDWEAMPSSLGIDDSPPF